MSSAAPRRLFRSRDDRMVSGVSGGLASYFDVDPVLVRLLWVAGAVFSGGLLLLAYIILWIVVPEEPQTLAPGVRVMDPEPGSEMSPTPHATDAESSTFTSGEEETRVALPETALQESSYDPYRSVSYPERRRNWAGITLVAIGLLFLASNFGLFRWFDWARLWPLLLVAVGALLLMNRSRR